MRRPPSRTVGAFNVLFFGSCAAAYARWSRQASVSLRLDASGIEHRHPHAGAGFRFAWPAISKVEARPGERGSTVVLTLGGPVGRPADTAPDWARARGAWPPLAPRETTLSPAELDMAADELADEIERFRRHDATASR